MVCGCVFVDVYYMMGAPNRSSERGSGEAWNRTYNHWFTRHSTYPLHQRAVILWGGGVVIFLIFIG